MITLLAFVFALGLLITIHEYGHYRAAVAAGVKVLRFSIGFGKPLLKWTRGKDGTEFVIAAVPLGVMTVCLTPSKLHTACSNSRTTLPSPS